MVLEQDFLYWSIIEKLVLNEKYSILALSQDGGEILLQPYRQKQFTIVRLKRIDVDWGNTLSIDIEQAGRKFEQLLKNGVRGPIRVMNVYISSLPPVDDYPSVFEDGYSILKGKIDISSILIHSEQRLEGMSKLADLLSVPLKVEMDSFIEEDDVQRIRNHVIASHNKQREEEKEIFQHGKPFFTYIFLGIQIIMFVLLEMFGGSTNNQTLIDFGAKFNPLIYEGEWWRFLTPIILHIGFLHLFMNSLALYYIGPAVEKAYGRFRFLLIYIIAGVAGTFASFAFSPNLSAGASGAIFGCFGALLYIGVQNRQVFLRTIGPNILMVIAINLAFGFAVPNIDNAGHIGGLVGGFLAAFIVQLPKKRNISFRLIGVIATALLFIILYRYGYPQAKEQYSQYTAMQGQEMIQDNKYDEAYDYLNNAISNNTRSNDIIFMLSVAEIGIGKFDEALKHLQEVVENDDSYHQAHFNLALLYVNTGNSSEALNHINKALQYDPENENYKTLKNEITQSNNET